jgi:hypothetical protein
MPPELHVQGYASLTDRVAAEVVLAKPAAGIAGGGVGHRTGIG